ncbi:PCRF domain-containing protein [endosymbiont GvMRE of Glomus versiforme]|uniref:PCRF domain-containing protein n=1 Tax=endosymbiont GvMRE of Glomus versiforme TaxID=2039283 RepID=UPI000ECDF840|nr:PCRF domain-containing protein [endosymbiont GvMRE of Glomus versiforme]RHZ37655.1 Peptide chain release factor 1 [endosymbiont GvMRE of Glomus versiforme]
MSNAELEKKIINFFQQLEPKGITSPSDFSFSPKTKNSQFTPFLKIKNDYEKIDQEIREYQLLKQETTDTESQNFLEQEINLLETKKTVLIEKVKQELISQEKNTQKVLIEIRPGTGGVEAGLFARDLYRMYVKFAKKKGWREKKDEEEDEIHADSLGNFTFASFFIKSKEVYKYLKNEAGIHRVQRVPVTENKGRLQTSTVSVVILPEIQDITVKINPQDLKIETCRSSGSGGQHVNTTDSAVKITHKPTGIIATSQAGRSQHDNKEKAMFVLKNRLFEKYCQEQEREIGNLRSSAIGTSERAESIRTYNYPQNRVTDDRLRMSWNKLKFIIEGDLEEICQKLIDYEVEKKLENYQKLTSKK